VRVGELEKLLETIGRALREAGLEDTMHVTLRDEDGEIVEDLGEMKLPESKQ
jgi:hypothetical protein